MKVHYNCPECGEPSRLLDSRVADYGRRRRFECAEGHRFTTMEIVMVKNSLVTLHVDKSGRVDFSSDGVDAFKNRIFRAIERVMK